jgi:tRNA U55 pseudouridine synthase TruB
MPRLGTGRVNRSRQQTLNKPGHFRHKNSKEYPTSAKFGESTRGYDMLDGEATMLESPNYMVVDSMNDTPSQFNLGNTGFMREESKTKDYDNEAEETKELDLFEDKFSKVQSRLEGNFDFFLIKFVKLDTTIL